MDAITVTLYESDAWNVGLEENFGEALKQLLGLYESIPEEFRGEASLEVSAYDSYGDPKADITIQYKRPLTEEEVTQTQQEEAAHNLRRKEDDLYTLARLKALYEENN